MEGDAEAYLRLASRLKRKHFSHGHSSLSEKKKLLQAESTLVGPAKPPQLLPMKKRKRTDDSDSDAENGDGPLRSLPGGVGHSANLPTSSSASQPPVEKNGSAAKKTLMEKWFPGSTLRNATLDAAQAPTLDYTDFSVTRMNAMRERLLMLRTGVEDVLNYASLKESNNFVNETADWNWYELRDVLSQLTSSDAFRTKKRVMGAVKWVVSTKSLTLGIPNSPTPRLWDMYLNQNGPECSRKPPLSLFVWLDSACTTALFTALVNRMLKLYKQGMKRVPYMFHIVNESVSGENGEEEGEEVEEEESEPCEGKKECKVEMGENNEEPDYFRRLPRLCGNGLDEDVISLLSFLRVLMPVDVEDEHGNAIHHFAGYGVWLYACLAAVDIPLEPDLDRLVHEFFRAACQQIRTLGKIRGIQGSNRGAIVNAFPSRSDDKSPRRVYNAISDVRREDVLALHSIIIILAKVFRQNQNRLIPL